MFSWFKKKPLQVSRDYSISFDLPHDHFAKLALDMVESYDPNGRIQLLIALKNLSILHKVHADIKRKKGESVTVREIVENTEEVLAQQTDEIVARRLHWFCQSALILECMVNQAVCEAHYEVVLRAWILFLESHHCLQNVVKHNVLWSDDEKAWFKPIKGQEDMSLMLIASPAPNNIVSNKLFIESYKELSGGANLPFQMFRKDKTNSKIH